MKTELKIAARLLFAAALLADGALFALDIATAQIGPAIFEAFLAPILILGTVL